MKMDTCLDSLSLLSLFWKEEEEEEEEDEDTRTRQTKTRVRLLKKSTLQRERRKDFRK